MTSELKCPKCGGTNIETDDCYDTINGEENTIKELMCGYCKDCGINVQWEMVYQFIGYDSIEES